MYHSISENLDGYAISPTTFARQMESLAQQYRIIRLRDARAELTTMRANERCVAVTFDDAFSDFRDLAYPILRHAGIPASVFVPTGFVGRTNQWDVNDSRIPQRPIMDATDIRQLYAEGVVDFGSHTVDHPSMADVTTEEMQRQAIDSKRYLETLLRTPITTFAYPYGQLDNFSTATTRVIADAGYDIAVTTHWGTRNSYRNLLSLNRIHFRETDDAATVRAKVDGKYDWIAAKERIGFTVRWLRKRIYPQR